MIAFLFVCLLLLIIFIFIYNQLTKARILVNEAWSGIATFLQLRNDLIPNLVETVKGFAGHENKTLVDVIKARNESIAALTPEAQIEAAKNLGTVLLNFKSVAEQYPDLKANPNYLKLQDELAVIEEKLNQSRRYYNATVRIYNQKIAIFPHNMVANSFHFMPANFFQESSGSAKVPLVSFS